MTDDLRRLKSYNPNPLAETVANAIEQWWIGQGVPPEKFGGPEAICTLASLASNVSGICASNSTPDGPFEMFVGFAKHLLATASERTRATTAPGSTAVN